MMTSFLVNNLIAVGAVCHLPKRSLSCRTFRLFQNDLKSVCAYRPVNSRLVEANRNGLRILTQSARFFAKESRIANFFKDQVWSRFVGVGNRRRLGVLLYQSVEQVNYDDFYSYFELPDTFNSWFIITELHVWMLMAQIMDGSKRGELLRNDIVRAMWFHIDAKVVNLGEKKTKTLKVQIKELSGRLPVAMLIYDEGLLGTDVEMTCALWNKFFDKHCIDPIKLEVLVRYVRHQCHHLSSLNLRNYEDAQKVDKFWFPLADHIQAVQSQSRLR
ncbi:UNVERIFIED_CONTAM: hypothetical protein PYX00_009692 [Menopon gallinae]|uniref:Ubiquinol-cytochrome c chaperone domain-containing protein n=1 Tax=Menopon gallinae TaxID=328185 RepID=A0AAW2HCY4_9NEOP